MPRAMLEAHAPPDTGETPIAKMHLPYQPESAGQARRFVRETLTNWELAELIDSAELIISELATNAAKTGCGRKMTVIVERLSRTTVRTSVRDGSRTLPVLILASPDEECHRGLALVDRLTGGRWGAGIEPFGKVVHADISMPGPTPP